MRWKCVGRVNTLFPPPPSLSSASSMCPPILRATRHTNRSKEGERACKLCLHALSPACHVAPTCVHPCHMCGGALFPPPSTHRVHAPPLCANRVCRAAPKRYTPPHFSPLTPTHWTKQQAQDLPPLPLPAPACKVGAIGGAMRMGTGTQAAWGGPLPPFVCGGKQGPRRNAPLTLPPPSMPM